MAATRSAIRCAVSRNTTSPSANTGTEKQQPATNTAIDLKTRGKSKSAENIFL
jgi:hypothetical protein